MAASDLSDFHFFISIAFSVIGFLALAAIGIGMITILFGTDLASLDQLEQMPVVTFGAMFVLYLVGLIISTLAVSIYELAKLRQFWNNSTFEGCRFHFSGTLVEVMALLVGNLLLIVFTLGIGLPIAQMRVVRFFVKNISLHGALDLAAIHQSEDAEPSFGEGLAEGFDVGTI